MGLMDFLNNEGEKKPVEPAKPAGTTDFFGAAKAADNADTYTVVSGDSLAGAARAAMGEPPTGEIDLLARFFLQSR